MDFEAEPTPIPGNERGRGGAGGGVGGGSYPMPYSGRWPAQGFAPWNPNVPGITPGWAGGGGSAGGAGGGMGGYVFGTSPFGGSNQTSVYPTSWRNILGIGWTPHAQPVTGSYSPSMGYNPFGGSPSGFGGFSSLGFQGQVNAGVNSGMSYAAARAAATGAGGGGGPASVTKPQPKKKL